MSLRINSEAPNFTAQTTLSLQHLWRIGTATRVHYWTSGLAFLSRSANPAQTRQKALQAWRAWAIIHQHLPDLESPSDDEDAETDIWHQRYGAPRTFTTADDHQPGTIPNFDVLTPDSNHIPPFFAIEVEALPRGCDIEWQALGVRTSKKLSIGQSKLKSASDSKMRLKFGLTTLGNLRKVNGGRRNRKR